MAQRDAPEDDALASLVHELQNVLTVIRGHAQIVQRRLGRGEPPNADGIASRMGIIDDATRRMALKIGRLPDLNRRHPPDDEGPTPASPPANDG